MKYYVAFIGIVVMAISCSKEEEDPLFEDIPVVEGYIQPNQPLLIQIGRQLPFSETAEFKDVGIDDLEVTITSQGTSYTLTSASEGAYVDSAITIIENETYDLEFYFGDELISASTIIPSKPQDFDQSITSMEIELIDPSNPPVGGPGEQPDPVELTWTSNDDSYYLIVVENIEDDPISTFDFGDDAPPERVFRNEPVQGNNYNLEARSFNYYGTHRIILYHLNDDYASLYDDGETTSQNLTSPATVIENGVGIFTGINADTLYVEIY